MNAENNMTIDVKDLNLDPKKYEGWLRGLMDDPKAKAGYDSAVLARVCPKCGAKFRADSELDHCPICGYKPKDESPINGDKTGDKIQRPNHYTWRGTECFEVIKMFTLHAAPYAAYLMGNIIKYLYRYPLKNGVEDLKKARRYLDELIAYFEEVKP